MSMFGVARSDVQSLPSRVTKQENFVGSLQPRVASLEFRYADVSLDGYAPAARAKCKSFP